MAACSLRYRWPSPPDLCPFWVPACFPWHLAICPTSPDSPALRLPGRRLRKPRAEQPRLVASFAVECCWAASYSSLDSLSSLFPSARFSVAWVRCCWSMPIRSAACSASSWSFWAWPSWGWWIAGSRACNGIGGCIVSRPLACGARRCSVCCSVWAGRPVSAPPSPRCRVLPLLKQVLREGRCWRSCTASG